MKKLILLIVVIISSQLLLSQTTITTNHINNNGNGSVTFNVQNTNATDIIITDVHIIKISLENEVLYKNIIKQ
jgi:hypothetical protein